MYKEDLALNNLQWLICHKTKPNQIGKNCRKIVYNCVYAVDRTAMSWKERSLSVPKNFVKKHMILWSD